MGPVCGKSIGNKSRNQKLNPVNRRVRDHVDEEEEPINLTYYMWDSGIGYQFQKDYLYFKLP